MGTITATDPDQDAILRFYFDEPKSASSDEGFIVTQSPDQDGYDFKVSVDAYFIPGVKIFAIPHFRWPPPAPPPVIMLWSPVKFYSGGHLFYTLEGSFITYLSDWRF